MGDHPGESLVGQIKSVKGRNRVADIGLEAIEKRVRYLSAEEENVSVPPSGTATTASVPAGHP